MSPTDTALSTQITIRRMDLSDADRKALARLAQLDSRPRPEGIVLGAEVGGRLVAAISLDSGDVVADPFSRTGELRTLLELRAAQLGHRPARRLRGARMRRSPRAAVGGSPPGQIISMPRTP
jgi:hypothetical protein